MARKFETPKSIEEKTGISRYEIILTLRKNGIPTRYEVEKLILEGNLSDKQIAEMCRSTEHEVSQVRSIVRNRQKLMNSIPDDKKQAIKTKIMLGIFSAKNEASKFEVPLNVVKAFIEQHNIEQEFNIPEEKRRTQFIREWNDLRLKVENKYIVSQNYQQILIHGRVCKIIALYEDLLQPSNYAYIAYAYIKVDEYLKGIEIGEQYLQLEEPSIQGLNKKINEILALEKEQKTLCSAGSER